MEYMTTREAAERWGYTESTIRKWCKEGKIEVVHRAVKVGNRWQIPKDAPCPRPKPRGKRQKK